MLQKTGISIKRFITQRRNQSTPDLSCYDEARYSDQKFSISSPKRLSWLSETPSAEVLPLRRPNSNSTIRSHHVHQSITAHSSASSLCSCDCNAHPVLNEQHSLSKTSTTITQPEVLYLPPALPPNASDDVKSWRIIFPEELPRSSSLTASSKLRLMIPPSSTDIKLPAATTTTIDDDRTPTQSLKYTSQPDMEDLGMNVEQLIRETDEAFKAVGTALVSAKAATQGLGWYDSNTRSESPVFTRRSSRTMRKPSRSPIAPSPVSPIVRSPITKTPATTKKAKARPNIKKKTRLLTETVQPTSSRWAMINDVTTNMVDVFSGRRFLRLEADEMLTPSRIQKLKDAEDEKRVSEESIRESPDVDVHADPYTPTDQFYLESVLQTLPKLDEENGNEVSNPRTPLLIKSEEKKGELLDVSQKSRTLFEGFEFPSPPPPPIPLKNPRRASASTKGIPLLPTIPEVSPLNLTPTRFFARNHSSDTPCPEPRPQLEILAPQGQILLPSTNVSILSPFYKHGSIKIERVIKVKRKLTLSPEEEGLDWVAFQMAISGNMDEYGRDVRSNSEWELDEVEMDEIEEWWFGLGIEMGGLECACVEEEVELQEEKGPVRRDKGLVVKGVGPCIGVHKEAQEELIRTWKVERDTEKVIVEGQTKEEQPKFLLPPPPLIEIRRPSVAESMPPSPMLDLGRVSPMKDGDGDIIPMGFNLGHDLGDFLRWETNHVQMFIGDE